MTHRALPIGLLVLFVNASATGGQSSGSPTRDPRALALATTSLQALAGPTTLSNLMLQAMATYTAGSDLETGTATLEAFGDVASNVTLNLSSGRRQEIRNGPAGQWSGPDSVVHPMAVHNCWTDAAWFSPAFVLAEIANDASIAVAYVGVVTHDGITLQQIRFWRVALSQTMAAGPLIQALSAEDLYFDATGLPVALDFNTHADDDLNINIAVEIQYANYQRTAGVLAPTLIHKLLNNSPLLDFSVTAVAVNTNLSPSDFTVTAQPL